MNYQRIYDSIISNANSRTVNDDYTERHHTIPRCLGGSDDSDNIAILTYKEHFMCHYLLCKIYPDNHKIKSALAYMLSGSINRVTNMRTFDIVKRELRGNHFPWLQNKEPWNKGKTGVQIAWNRGMKCESVPDERKIRISNTLKERYKTEKHPRSGRSSWNKGKTGVQVAWNKNMPAPKIVCEHCLRAIDRLNYTKWHGERCKKK